MQHNFSRECGKDSEAPAQGIVDVSTEAGAGGGGPQDAEAVRDDPRVSVCRAESEGDQRAVSADVICAQEGRNAAVLWACNQVHLLLDHATITKNALGVLIGVEPAMGAEGGILVPGHQVANNHPSGVVGSEDDKDLCDD